MGFAGIGSGIALVSADTASSDAQNRLSWHLDLPPLSETLSLATTVVQQALNGASAADGGDGVSAAVVDAATTLAAFLSTRATLDVAEAQQVAELLSTLLGVQSSSGVPHDADVASSIDAAVWQLARAVAATPGSGEVTLSSPNLNLTAEARLPTDLASRPVQCNSSTGIAARADLPLTIEALLQTSDASFDASLPVTLVLYTSAINYVNPLQAAALPIGVNASHVFSSPLVSFSLMQEGRELRLANASDAVNVSMPYAIQNGRTDTTTCLGTPENATEAGCGYEAECRWWDDSASAWSAEGCVTTTAFDLPDAPLMCVCDHLTTFIVFEFPTSAEQLLAAVLGALKINALSERAWQCIATPYFHKIRVVWIIDIALLAMLVLGIGNAVLRDRREIQNIERLVAGRKKEARMKILAAIQAAAAEQRRSQDKAAAIRNAAKRKRCASMFAGAGSPGRGLFPCASTAAAASRSGGGGGGEDSALPQLERRAATMEYVAPRRSSLRRSIAASIFGAAPQPPPTSSPPPSPPPPPAGRLSSSSGGSWRLGLGSRSSSKKREEAGRRRQSRVQEDVLGIFGNRRSSLSIAEGGGGGGGGSWRGGSSSIGAASAANGAAPVSAAVRWRQAGLVAQQQVLAKRWHKDVDRTHKRLWLEFKASHTLLSGLVYRGSSGFTRAQTVMILLNSLALEIVTLCMFYSAPSDGPLVINPVSVVVGGVFAAAICIPAMLTFSWLYDPIIFVNMARWALRTLFCWPCDLLQCFYSCTKACQRRAPPTLGRKVHPQPAAAAAAAAAKDDEKEKEQERKVVVLATSTPTAIMTTMEPWSTSSPPPVYKLPTSSLTDSGSTTSPNHSRVKLEPLAAPMAGPPSNRSFNAAASARWSALALSPACTIEAARGAANGATSTATATATTTSAASSSTPTAGASSRNGGSFVSTRLRPMAPLPSMTLQSPPPSPPSSPSQLPINGNGGSHSERSSGSGSKGSGSLGNLLRRAKSKTNSSRQNAGGGAAPSREFSYASLNEHMLSQSLTRSWGRGDRRAVARILFGWLSNLLLFFGLLFFFSLYGCELFSTEAISPNAHWEELLLSWGFSLFQRFIVNEPMLILASKGAPMLFTSAFCANVCGETIVNILGLTVAAIATCIRNIKTGG